MPLSAGFTTFGALLAVGDGASPEVFTNVAEVSNVKLPSQDRGNVEFTHHESPVEHRELKPGLRTAGTCDFTINYIPDNATHMNAAGGLLFFAEELALAAIHNWQVTLPDSPNTLWVFPGFLSKFDPQDMPVEGRGAAACSITISSASTLP